MSEICDKARESVELVKLVASAIYDGLDKNDPRAHLGSKYLDEEITIDGSFNLTAVAVRVLDALASHSPRD